MIAGALFLGWAAVIGLAIRALGRSHDSLDD